MNPVISPQSGGNMGSCSTEKLVQLLDKQLDLDGKLDVFDHLDQCQTCQDTVYQILRARDAKLFTVPAPKRSSNGTRHSAQAQRAAS
jgi:hypothetical protein